MTLTAGPSADYITTALADISNLHALNSFKLSKAESRLSFVERILKSSSDVESSELQCSQTSLYRCVRHIQTKDVLHKMHLQHRQCELSLEP